MSAVPPKSSWLAGLGLACLLAGSSAPAALPTQLSQLPVYPGARPTQLEDGEWEEPSLQGGAKPEAKAYVVDAAVEDVLRWYAQRLGTRPEAHLDFDEPLLQRLPPGGVTAVNNDVHPHTSLDSDVDDGAGHILVTAAQKRALLAKCRAPYAKGQWLSDSSFEWMRRNEDDSRSQYGVYLSDAGLADGWKGCVKRTRIVLVAEHGRSEQALRDEREQAQDERLREVEQQLGTKAPTEHELGAPLYPGARYDARASAGMSMDDQRGYLFVSDDPPAKVVAFYEKKLGKKAQGDAETGYLIALKGSGLVPEEGLAVQRNMLPGGGKTLITVMRQKAP